MAGIAPRDHRDDRKRQRKERKNAAKVVGYEPVSHSPAGHAPTVLRDLPMRCPPRGGAANSDQRRIAYYNFDRAHTGRLTKGRIPGEIVYGARKTKATR
jgi:hypothetical protein